MPVFASVPRRIAFHFAGHAVHGIGLSLAGGLDSVRRMDRERPHTAAGEEDSGAAPASEQGEAPEASAADTDVADEEQAQWNHQRARAWHQRRWLRSLIVLAVLTAMAAIIPYPLRITSECTIIPPERARVRAEMQGVLAEILVDEASPVKKGDVIARIDDRALKAERLRVLAEIDKIEAELAVLRLGNR